MMVPKLRFKGFHSQWFNSLLGDIGTFKNGLNKDKSEFGHGVPFVNLTDVFGKVEIKDNKNLSLVNANKKEVKDYSLLNGDVLFIRSSVKPTGVGETSVVTEDLENTVFSGFLIRYRNKSLLTSYKKHYFWHPGFRTKLLSLSTTSANTNINQDSLSSLDINIPCEAEQEKIANFLSSADEKIALLNKQHDLLCQYKKGMMQKIFSQELRFKDDNGKPFPKWKILQLKDVAIRVTRKNKENNNTILTISGRDGLVDQMTYFNKQIASKNVTGYYLIKKGEFAYNKSYSQGYPMGAIKMLSNYEKGVVSTLYICFKLNDEQSCDFYQHYFESGLQNRSIEKVAQEGARNHGLLNIGVNDFFDIELQVPSFAEQNKIARFLSAIEDKIAIKRAELDMLKKWKQGLLQQMLV